MSQIVAEQIACDPRDGDGCDLFVRDTMGRVWLGCLANETKQWIWSRVELPEDTV